MNQALDEDDRDFPAHNVINVDDVAVVRKPRAQKIGNVGEICRAYVFGRLESVGHVGQRRFDELEALYIDSW